VHDFAEAPERSNDLLDTCVLDVMRAPRRELALKAGSVTGDISRMALPCCDGLLWAQDNRPRGVRWLSGVLTTRCFRKSCGQNWADHLPMNFVEELMGHADISTTAEFYSTVSEEHEAKAQWIIEAITIGRTTGMTDA